MIIGYWVFFGRSSANSASNWIHLFRKVVLIGAFGGYESIHR
jgi:hypothetical protein